MNIPSRIEMRYWLATKEADEIRELVELVGEHHGDHIKQDVRYFLNAESAATKPKKVNGEVVPGKPIFPAPIFGLGSVSGEVALLDEHEQRKADIAADIESKKKLYGDNAA